MSRDFNVYFQFNISECDAGDGKWVKHPCPSKKKKKEKKEMSCQHLGASGRDISAAVIKT